MEIWILGAGVLVMLILAFTIHSNQNELEKRVNEGMRSNLKTALDVLDKYKARYEIQLTNDASERKQSFDAISRVAKEFDVMQVRQHTLEKNIRGATRTVNLIFGKPIPVQVENIPHTVIREKKGRGKAALIHDS